MPKPRIENPLSSAERVRRHRARRRAAGLRAVTRWHSGAPTWSDHRVAEAKSLALHVLAARRIAADPKLLERARATVARWLERYGQRPPAALREWQGVLEGPWEGRGAPAARARGEAGGPRAGLSRAARGPGGEGRGGARAVPGV